MLEILGGDSWITKLLVRQNMILYERLRKKKVKNNEKAIAKLRRLVKENREVDKERNVSYWFAHCLLVVIVVYFHGPKPGFLKEKWTKGRKIF